MDNRTRCINWVVGDEIWMQLYGMTTAQSLVTNIHTIITSGNNSSYDVLKSYNQLSHGKEGDTAYAINYENDNLLFNFAVVLKDDTSGNELARHRYSYAVAQANSVTSENYQDYRALVDGYYRVLDAYDSSATYYAVTSLKTDNNTSNAKTTGINGRYITSINGVDVIREFVTGGTANYTYAMYSYGNNGYVYTACGGAAPLYGVPVSPISTYYDNPEATTFMGQNLDKKTVAMLLTLYPAYLQGMTDGVKGAAQQQYAAQAGTTAGFDAYWAQNGDQILLDYFKQASSWAQGLEYNGVLNHDGTPTGYGWLEMGVSIPMGPIVMSMQVYTYYYEGYINSGN